MQSHPISRRRHLGLCGGALAGLFVPRHLPAASTGSTAPPNPKFQPAYDALADQMRRLYQACRVRVDGRELLRPCASTHYNGLWHDDLLSHAAEAGMEIPRRRDWARLIERSFARVHFSFGLVWNDPQRRTVAFGFYDSIRQTGLVLMASLVIKRGLERAAALFEKDLPAETIADWKTKAGRIGENLHRLFDAGAGGFVGATKVGRGLDVWGNGLAWPLATAAQREVIAASFTKHREAIFALGCTRQTPYPDGWPGTQAKGYQNQGFWATGTGFVLPALAEADPDFALRLAQDLVENVDKFKRHEFIDATGKPGGPADFLGSLSMPLMGLRAILSGRPLLDFM